MGSKRKWEDKREIKPNLDFRIRQFYPIKKGSLQNIFSLRLRAGSRCFKRPQQSKYDNFVPLQ